MDRFTTKSYNGSMLAIGITGRRALKSGAGAVAVEVDLAPYAYEHLSVLHYLSVNCCLVYGVYIVT